MKKVTNLKAKTAIVMVLLCFAMLSGSLVGLVHAQIFTDLSITKEASADVVIAGEELFYTITVTNNGPNPASNIIILDYLPSGVTYIADTGGGVLNGQLLNVTIPLSLLYANRSWSFMIKLKVDPDYVIAHGFTITNYANVTSDMEDTDLSNNEVTLTTFVQSEADLKVTKICKPDTTVQAGENVTYTIFVENLGPSTARNVVVADEIRSAGPPTHYLPQPAPTFDVLDITAPGYTASPTPPVYNIVQFMNISAQRSTNMNPGVRDIIEITVRADDPQDINNMVLVKSADPDPDLSNNQAERSINVDAVADLEMGFSDTPGKTDSSDPVYTGESFTYTLIVTNIGPSTAVNVVVKDWVPAGLSINNATCSAAEDGAWNIGVPGDPLRPTTFALDSMPAGQVQVMTINVTVLDPADPSLKTWLLHNDAVVSSDTFDPDNSNNLATEDTTILNSLVKETADLKVTKIVKPDTTVLAGETINCTIIVENLGSHYALNVSIRDEILSSGIFELVDCILDSNLNDEGPFYPTSPPGGMTLEFNLNEPLAPKNVSIAGRWVIQILLRANETQDINDVVNVFTRDIDGFISVDPDLSNNEAQCSIHVTGVADLELTKTDSPDPLPAIAGQGPFILTYTLTVTNHGPSTAVNVLIKDWLPEGLTIEYVTATGTGSCKAGVPGDLSSPTTCAFDSIAPGASENMTIRTVLLSVGLVIIKPSNILHNDAMVSSDTLDLDNSNDFATENTRVVEHSYELGTVSNTLGNPVTIGPILLVGLISIIVAMGIWKKRMLFAGSITKHLTELLKANGKRN